MRVERQNDVYRLPQKCSNRRALSFRQHVDGQVVIPCCSVHHDCVCKCIFLHVHMFLALVAVRSFKLVVVHIPIIHQCCCFFSQKGGHLPVKIGLASPRGLI